MKHLATIALLASGLVAAAQQNCTNNQDAPMADRCDYQAGQAIGNAAVAIMGRIQFAHQLHKQRDAICRANGEGYYWTIQTGDGYEYPIQTFAGRCTEKQARIKPGPMPKSLKTYKGSYPECSQQTDPDVAKACNASLAPDAPIVAGCEALATNEGGTQPESYRYCAAAQAAMAKRMANP